MAKSLFPNVCLLLAALLMPRPTWGQVSAADRAEIVRLAQQRGGSEADVSPIVQDINTATERGVPQAPLVNKAKEGLAKGVPPARVHGVVRNLVGDLDRARDVLAGTDAAGPRAVIALGEAFFRGVKPDEIDELRRLLQQGGPAATADRLALGAQTWAMLREGGVAANVGLRLVADAVRQGAPDAELARMAREVVAARQADAAPTRVQRPAAPERPRRPERVEPPSGADRR